MSLTKGIKHAHTTAICTDGNAYAWGDHYKGQLGTLSSDWTHASPVLQPLPAKVILPDDVQVAKTVGGGIHNSLISTDGRLFTWGCGSDGRLGHPEYEGFVYLYKESHPKRVEALQGRVIDVASSYHSMICIS